MYGPTRGWSGGSGGHLRGALSPPLRRADAAVLTSPPAVADRPWTGLPGGTCRPGSASPLPMGRPVAVGGLGRGRGPPLRPAVPPRPHAWASAGRDASGVGVGVTAAGVARCRGADLQPGAD